MKTGALGRVRRGDEGGRDGRRRGTVEQVWKIPSGAGDGGGRFQICGESRRLLQISPNAARQDEIGEERENVEMKVMSYSTNKAEPSQFWTSRDIGSEGHCERQRKGR